VAYPKKGMHDWIGSIDINSLYPSAIRALNMGPETIVGQLRPVMTDRLIRKRWVVETALLLPGKACLARLEYTAVMEQQRGTEITIDWQDGAETVHSAAEVWRMIFDSNQPWMLSANGTIFTYETEAVIPGLLKRWYAERREMQAKLKECTTREEEEYWDKNAAGQEDQSK
jgi:DNA polymerase elongation subunit (family B)